MNAFVCASPVQVMRAVQLKMRNSMFGDDADLFLLPGFHGDKDIYENLKKEKLFRNVYLFDFNIKLKKNALFQLLFGQNSYHKILRQQKYKKLIAFNIEGVATQALYNMNKSQKNFEYHCVEDCPCFYPVYEPTHYKWFHPFRILGIDKQAFHINKWWSSCPEYMHIPKSFGCDLCRLDKINIEDVEYIEIVNRIFEYRQSLDLENIDILIMDESFYQDGKMIGNADYNLYCKIKDKFPEKKISIKMHPRTVHNRYEGSFPIISNSHFPWELQVLNVLSKKKKVVQVGIICGTMVSDRFMFGVGGPKIILAPIFKDKIGVGKGSVPNITDELISDYEHLKNTFDDDESFVICYSEDDVFDAIARL